MDIARKWKTIWEINNVPTQDEYSFNPLYLDPAGIFPDPDMARKRKTVGGHS